LEIIGASKRWLNVKAWQFKQHITDDISSFGPFAKNPDYFFLPIQYLLGVKWQRQEAHNLPLPNAEVKNVWI